MVYDVFSSLTILNVSAFPAIFVFFYRAKFQLFRHAYFAHYNDKYFEIAAFIEKILNTETRCRLA